MTTIEILELIFKLVKRVKKPIVKIFPDGKVIGTDEQFASLNFLEDDTMGILPCPFIIFTKDITAFMRDVSKDYSYHNPKFDCPYLFTTNTGLVLENHIDLNYNIDELYNRVMSQVLTQPILFDEDNFNNDDIFSLKVSDGAKMYQIKNYLMSSFNSIHPVTKTDKVELIIRDYDQYSYTGQFIITKKKENYKLHEILRFRKL